MFALICVTLLYALALADNLPKSKHDYETSESGNPFILGNYSDPACAYYGAAYWVFATNNSGSPPSIAVFSSPNLVQWTTHEKALTINDFAWAKGYLYSPSTVYSNVTSKYYLYFSAADYPHDPTINATTDGFSGIGVGVAEKPEGPYTNPIPNNAALLSSDNENLTVADADGPAVMIDDDKQVYMYYGQNGTLRVMRLDENTMTGFKDDDYTVVTPAQYYEGAKVFRRSDIYYLIWSEGPLPKRLSQSFPSGIRYGMSRNPMGPFLESGKILMPDPAVAVNISHSAIIKVPSIDIWYMLYARSQTIYGNENPTMGLAYDRMYFDWDKSGVINGFIKPVKMLVKNNFNDYNCQGRGLWLRHNATIGSSLGPTPYSGTCLKIDASDGGMVITPTNHTRMRYDIDLRVWNETSETASAGVVFRGRNVTLDSGGSDDYEGYYAGITVDKNLILGVANGSFKMLESVSLEANFNVSHFHHLRIAAEGNNISVYLDHQHNLSVLDGTYSSGWSGMRVHQAVGLFDNLEISRFGSAYLPV